MEESREKEKEEGKNMKRKTEMKKGTGRTKRKEELSEKRETLYLVGLPQKVIQVPLSKPSFAHRANR